MIARRNANRENSAELSEASSCGRHGAARAAATEFRRPTRRDLIIEDVISSSYIQNNLPGMHLPSSVSTRLKRVNNTGRMPPSY